MKPMHRLILLLFIAVFMRLPVQAGMTSIALGDRETPISRVTVPVGDRLQVTAPAFAGSNFVWTRNGVAMPGATNPVLTLPSVVSTDAGIYTFTAVTSDPIPERSQQLLLGVGPVARLINSSVRATVSASPGGELISGFVVAAGNQSKRLIVRAIGPSLALFGIQDPLPQPVLRILDSGGKPYQNGYVYPAVVGAPNYETDLADSLARSGAFPAMAGAADAVVMMPFRSGSYTAEVTSGSGAPGTVLLELYEVP
jgi:hypothetical protein